MDDSNSQKDTALTRKLFQAGVQALMREGWRVSRARGMGGASVREIERNGERHRVSIRTSQDQFIAFPPKTTGQGWTTLDDVDVVLAVSVDANEPPRDAIVHWLPADEVRAGFNRALKARTESGHVKPAGHGIFLPLYKKDESKWRFVGGGFAADRRPLAAIPLNDVPPTRETPTPSAPPIGSAPAAPIIQGSAGGGSVIGDAKRMISRGLGVPESAIRITIEA